MLKRYIGLFSCCLILFLSCHSQKETVNETKEESMSLSAGGIQVKAQLIQLKTIKKSQTDQQAVEGRIKVISVLRRGNNFSNQISRGVQLAVQFRNYQKQLKPLEKGNTFIAVIESRLQINSENPLYIITNYRKEDD